MKVLLVDDEIFTIRMLQSLIHWKELGLEITGCAQDGQEAYEKTVRENPDIIISDIRMPGMSGLELLKKVKQYNGGIRVILMSAYADFSYVQEGMKSGCCDYILKPVDEGELETSLRKVVLEIQGQKEQEKVISKSVEQLDKIRLYQYMKTGHGKNKLKKPGQPYPVKFQRYSVFLMQIDPDTIDEYNASRNIEMGEEGYVTRILEQILSLRTRNFMVFDYEEGCWTILLEELEGAKREETAEILIENMRADMGIQMNICFSSVGRGMEELPSLFEEVKNLSKYRFYVGEEAILGCGYNCKKEEIQELCEIGTEKDKADRSGNQESGLLSEQVASYSTPVRESLALIEERYNENLSLEEICEKIAVSKTYFCYLFKRETGMSLWNYLTFVRLNHARELLETTELKNYEIAFQVGYENPSYFSRLFKKYEGVTPNEYRAAKRNIVTE